MNKAQKITIIIFLLMMFFILMYPPVGRIFGPTTEVFPVGRNLIFSFPQELEEDFSRIQVDIKRLTVELLAVACLGGALMILFGLKKK